MDILFINIFSRSVDVKRCRSDPRVRKIPWRRAWQPTQVFLPARERPRETFFNTSRGQIPLPWLGSNDALPLATRMETRLPWRPTRGSLTSPPYLVRNRTLGPPLENNPEIPRSPRDEGLRLLHGLETNLATSLQTPQEA